MNFFVLRYRMNSSLQLRHECGHINGCLGSFSAAVVVFAKATDIRLVFIIEQKNFVNDRDFVRNLKVYECAGYGFADELGMGGFASDHNAQADDRRISCFRVEQPCDYNGDLIRAWNAENIDWLRLCVSECLFGGAQHRIHVTRVVIRGDNCKSADCFLFLAFKILA